jgi:hypothetical protein
MIAKPNTGASTEVLTIRRDGEVHMPSKPRLSLPSPAMIVAVLALVVALAGTAVAAPDLATRAISRVQVIQIAKTQAKNEVAKRALGNRVITRVRLASVPDGEARGQLANCAPGEKMLGGGATAVGTTVGELVALGSSGPVGTGGDPATSVPPDGTRLTAWFAFMRNEAGAANGPGGTATLNVYAVCSR